MRRLLFSAFLLLGIYSSRAQCTDPTVPVLNIHDTTICQYDYVLVTASGNLNDAWDWYWYSDSCGGNFLGVGPSFVAWPDTTTIYYVRGEGGCVTGGPCATFTVTINPAPIINTSAEVDTPADCGGGTNGSVTGIYATGNGPFQYSWDNGPYSSSSTLSGVGVGPHDLVVIDANGCVNSTEVHIYNPPPPVINNSGLSITKPSCGSLNGSITGINATGSPTLTYSWDNGSTTSTSSSLTGVGAGIYHLLVKDGHNCTATQSYTITSTSGSVAPTPTVSGPSSPICWGSSAPLSIVNPSMGSTYTWTTSNWQVGTGTSFTVNSASPQGSTTCSVFVVVTDIAGCQNSTTHNFTVNPLPTVNVTPHIASGCWPICVAFMNTSSSTGTCNWNFGDGSTSSSCSPQHCYNTAGTYLAALQLTDANGCKNSDTANINAYPIPTAAFSSSPQPTTISNPTINFIDMSSGTTVVSWQWNFGTTPASTSSLQNPSVTYQDTGTYQVTLVVTSNYGCRDSITQIVKIDPAIGIPALQPGNTELYPNPANKVVILKGAEPLGQITIVNSLGEILYRTMSDKREEKIDLSLFPTGTYLLRQNKKTFKLVKE